MLNKRSHTAIKSPDLAGSGRGAIMQTTTLRLVTIIAEHVLEERILGVLHRLGVRGFSISEVRGEGTRGIHASDWQGGNLKIETIVSQELADRILAQISHDYFADYAVVAYVTTVEVIRGEKFR
jgi:nitrogen regulatory protein P-II 2